MERVKKAKLFMGEGVLRRKPIQLPFQGNFSLIQVLELLVINLVQIGFHAELMVIECARALKACIRRRDHVYLLQSKFFLLMVVGIHVADLGGLPSPKN